MADKKKKAKSASRATETPSSEPPATAETTETAEAEAAPERVAEPEPEPEPAAEEPTAPIPWYSDITVLLGLFAPMIFAIFAMSRVKRFTVDDSYISFRYARNWAKGLGLVYNEGERVEGYTNFLWTILIGIGIKLGIDPDVLAKLLGASCALGAMVLLWRISGRLQPYAFTPCIATWLFATSAPNTGYAVFGLETSLFVALVLGGVFLFFREEEVLSEPHAVTVPTKLPWSGLVFGLAGLTRPEAPMYIGVVMLFLGRGMFAKRNLVRGGLFVAVVGAHLLWRHSFYGSWVPNTLGAKTGNLDGQLTAGWDYFSRWVTHTGPLVYVVVAAIAYSVTRLQRALLALSVLSLLVVGYVILVGGDWMQNFRFLVPFEPLAFIVIDVAVRTGGDRLRGSATATRALPVAAILAIAFLGSRGYEQLKMHRFLLATEDKFWRLAAGGTAKLFLEQPKDWIAIGDIGYIGYKTDYPIIDLLGLVDPEIPKMKGGYTQKVGKEWLDYFFRREPRYVIVISSSQDCEHPSTTGSIAMWRDRRFRQQYGKLTFMPLENNFAWCIYERKGARAETPGPITPLLPSEPSSSSSAAPSSAVPRHE